MRPRRYHITSSLAVVALLSCASAVLAQIDSGPRRLPAIESRHSQGSLLWPSDTRIAIAPPPPVQSKYDMRYQEARLADQSRVYNPHVDNTYDDSPYPGDYYQSPGPSFGKLPAPTELHFGHYNDGLGPEVRVFEPKARVFFDLGEERPGKLDIFHDGSLAPSINFIELYWAEHWPEGAGHQDWRWGPIIGAGISSPAGTNGAAEATGAPVLLCSIGLQFEFVLNQQAIDKLREQGASPRAINEARQESPRIGFEFGLAGGVSSDETLDFKGDGAAFAGVTLHRGK